MVRHPTEGIKTVEQHVYRSKKAPYVDGAFALFENISEIQVDLLILRRIFRLHPKAAAAPIKGSGPGV